MTIPLQKSIIYGPVHSRRLGRSLGINLLPVNRKYCNFNCVYCQYGWTNYALPEPDDLPTVQEIETVLADYLSACNNLPDYLTFSGNGEPTLHPSFPEIVTMVKKVRDRLAPKTLVALLSNSVSILQPDISSAISVVDVPILKLDVADNSMLMRYNKPLDNFRIEDLIEQIRLLPYKIIQTLFTTGPSGNFTTEHINKWLLAIKKIQPNSVQIYSLDRGAPSRNITGVSGVKLKEICNRLEEMNIHCKVY